jgi:hypothetical protein
MRQGPVPSFGAVIDPGGSPLFDDAKRFSRYLERLRGKRVRITVRRERRGRSLSQNRRLWAIYTAIAEWSGHEPEEIHEALKQMLLPSRSVELPNGRFLTAAPSTAILDAENFSHYMHRVELWALEQGCELPDWDDFS